MANASYDTLTITINADSKEANRSIKNLSNNLNKLNDSATKLNTRRLGEVKGLLLNIAKIDFSNVSKGLQDVVSAFKYFQSKTAQKVAPIINPKDFDKQIKSYQNVLGKDYNFSFLGGGNTTQSELTSTIERAKSLLEVVKELNLTGEQNKIVFKELGLSVNALQEKKFNSVAEALKKAGVEGGKIKKIIDELNESLNELKDTTGKTSSGFAKMFKNIMRYRVVRKLIQGIFQEISNAMTELANVDDNNISFKPWFVRTAAFFVLLCGCACCFSNPVDSRKALASCALRRGAGALPLYPGRALPLHPANGHRAGTSPQWGVAEGKVTIDVGASALSTPIFPSPTPFFSLRIVCH